MSSKRRLRRTRQRHGCEGKVRHPAARAAKQEIRQALARGGVIRGELQSYHCGFCGGWHIGHGRGS